MQGNVLMWLLLTVFLGMEECEGNSGRSLEQEHILTAGVCVCVGGGVLLSQLGIKVLCRLVECFLQDCLLEVGVRI